MEANQNLKISTGRIFLKLFFPLLIVVIVANIAIYFIIASKVMEETRQDLMQIAANLASHISVDAHESLIKPDDQETDNYRNIEKYFQAVMDGNNRIENIYTLRPTANPKVMTFVVDAAVTGDINNNGVIEDEEQKAGLGEEYDITGFPEMTVALNEPAADRTTTSDKWGIWISGYAPLKDSSEKTVAIVGVDILPVNIFNQQNKIFIAILYLDLILIFGWIIIAILISVSIRRSFAKLVQ